MKTSATARPSSRPRKAARPRSLCDRLGATLDEAAAVLDRLTVDELLAPTRFRATTSRGLDAVYQVVEHFGLHYGQIVYITKLLYGKRSRLLQGTGQDRPGMKTTWQMLAA